MAESEKPADNGRDAAGRFTQGNPGGGRRKMDPEILEMLQGATKAAAKKLIAALDAERPYTVGFGDSATLEMVPDWDLQVKAANAILDRVYGKPAQAITGDDGGPVHVSIAELFAKLKQAEDNGGKPG